MVPIAVLFAGLFVAGCLTGAVLDLRFRRIPNLLCVGLLAAGIAQAVATGPANGWISHLLFAVLCLIGGAVLFRFQVFGGGDAKFLTGLAAWFPLAAAVPLLVAISLFGLVLFMAWFAYRRLRGLKISRKATGPFEQLPYGVAIAAGALFVRFAL